MQSSLYLRAVVLGLVLAAVSPICAAQAQQSSSASSAKAAAIEDLTGLWVSNVSEDWRWRMVTPPKEDYASVPLNAQGIREASTWDWRKDQAAGLQCKAYGAAAIMRVPTRLHISWQDDNTLKVETDAGTQTRLFHFGGQPYMPGEARSLQGVSVAQWESTAVPASGLAIVTILPPPPSYALQVVTRGLRAGYLRTNGVPYSEDAVVTEYYDIFTYRHQQWLIVTTMVDDPKYLVQPFITTTNFKREADGARWHPTPCEITPPPRAVRPIPPNGYLPQAATH